MTVTVIDALFWVAALVLVVAGASKLVEPRSVAATLAALRTRREGSASVASGASPLWPARVVGAVEVAVGVAALAVGGVVLAAAVAVAYLAFAGVVVVARRRGLPSCGCFGAGSAPPSWVHVAVNVLSAAVAAVAAAGGGSLPVADGLELLGSTGVPVAALVLLATVLVVVVDTTVADVVEATRSLAEQGAATASAATDTPSVAPAVQEA